jgi:hypothetical protein
LPVRGDTPVPPAPPEELPAAPVPVATPQTEADTATDEIRPGPSPLGHKECSSPAVQSPSIRIPEFLGDQAPIGSLLTLPNGQIQGHGVLFVPSARYFKISDNDSPRPQTREYFSFNYFYNLDGVINQRAGADVEHIRIHREVFGVEWAEPDGSSSVGLRLPLATFNAANNIPGLDGTSTDLGDLSVIFKHVLWEDQERGRLLSAGLAVIPTTGPGSFAGSNDIKVFHNTSLQPFCGWIWPMKKFYLQGFTAVDAPLDLNDVVMLSNDFAAGYILCQRSRAHSVIAVVPTVELHLNTPLNHRGVLDLTDQAGNPDLIDVTGGVQFEYNDRSSLGIAFATPVTGPRMFDFQILVQVRCRY